jgi:hypothetical protein
MGRELGWQATKRAIAWAARAMATATMRAIATATTRIMAVVVRV